MSCPKGNRPRCNAPGCDQCDAQLVGKHSRTGCQHHDPDCPWWDPDPDYPCRGSVKDNPRKKGSKVKRDKDLERRGAARGLFIRYLPANMAWAFMFGDREIVKIHNDYNDAAAQLAEWMRQIDSYQSSANPGKPKTVTVYPRILAIEAWHPDGKGRPYRHEFKSKTPVLGLPDGSLLIPARGRRLWGTV